MLNALKGFHGEFKTIYGQMALRLDDESYIMTDGNRALAGLGSESLVVCDINKGDLGEIFRTSNINALIFGLSPAIIEVSKSSSPVPVTLEDLAHISGAHLNVIPNTSPAGIVSALSQSSVCLIQGVGSIASGSNLKKAVAGIQIIEKFCEAEVYGKMIGGTVPIEANLAEQCRKEFNEDYINRNEDELRNYVSFDEKEFTLRSKLVELGKDLLRHDLTYGSWRNISARLSYREMLITPSAMDYFEITIEDIVKVNISSLEYGDQRVPSSESASHAAIYSLLPDCQAVVHTHSNALSVFAACEAGFAISDPAMQKLIGDVLVTGFYPSGTHEHSKTVAKTMKRTHAAIIPHHGAIFTGPSLDVAFTIAKSMESMARNILGFYASSQQEDEDSNARDQVIPVLFSIKTISYLISSSAICTALVAAPLRTWSPQHQRLIPFSLTRSLLILPT